MAKRSKSPQFRVTPEEDEHLRKAAADANMKLSDYLRAVTLHPTVVVVDGLTVTLIPSTVTLAAADEALRDRFRRILEGLQTPPAPAPPAAAPAPAAAPPSSPGTADQGMVGASSPAAAPPAAPSQGGGSASPGESKPAVSQIERCPHCGGTEGRHQSFCETVRGEPPVAPAAEAAPDPMEAYVEARVGEGELRVVAEAEWRQREVQPEGSVANQLPAPAVDAAKAPCPSCGTMKLPAVQCPDCGRRPG